MNFKFCKIDLLTFLLSADIRTSVDKMLKDLDWVRLTYRWDHHLLISKFLSVLRDLPYLFVFSFYVYSFCSLKMYS